MFLASYSFHFVMHLFVIYYTVFIVFMLDVILDHILFNTFSSFSALFIVFDIGYILDFRPTNSVIGIPQASSLNFPIISYWCYNSMVSSLDSHYCQTYPCQSKSPYMHPQFLFHWLGCQYR